MQEPKDRLIHLTLKDAPYRAAIYNNRAVFYNDRTAAYALKLFLYKLSLGRLSAIHENTTREYKY